jgi:hypothetical protein
MPSEEPGKNISEAEIERRLAPTGKPPKAKIVLVRMNKRSMLVQISDGGFWKFLCVVSDVVPSK